MAAAVAFQEEKKCFWLNSKERERERRMERGMKKRKRRVLKAKEKERKEKRAKAARGNANLALYRSKFGAQASSSRSPACLSPPLSLGSTCHLDLFRWPFFLVLDFRLFFLYLY